MAELHLGERVKGKELLLRFEHASRVVSAGNVDRPRVRPAVACVSRACRDHIALHGHAIAEQGTLGLRVPGAEPLLLGPIEAIGAEDKGKACAAEQIDAVGPEHGGVAVDGDRVAEAVVLGVAAGVEQGVHFALGPGGRDGNEQAQAGHGAFLWGFRPHHCQLQSLNSRRKSVTPTIPS